MVRLTDALERNDLDELRRQAHRIKGASVVVGARRVATTAARMEAAAGSEGDADDDLHALRDEVAAAFANVGQEIASSYRRDTAPLR